jgi:predicted MFS family arabinose efflux permease
MNTAMSVIWMTWMSQNADDAPEAAGGLMVAAVQSLDPARRGARRMLLDALSIQATFIGSVILAGAALVLIGNGRRLLKSS